MRSSDDTITYLRKNYDEIAIVTVLGRLAFSPDDFSVTEDNLPVLSALRRSAKHLNDADIDELSSYLEAMDENQIAGLANNVKGILHEMEFMRLENSDGDSVVAEIFASTSHPDTDIRLTDTRNGESWEIQLKATDSDSYIQAWLDEHPDGEIQVTSEIAERLGLPSSGFENEALTADVENVVDQLIDHTDANDDIWSYFPELTLISISLVVLELWRRRQREEISSEDFKSLVLKATGMKAAKFSILIAALSIPGLNVAVSAGLIASLILGAQSLTVKTQQPTSYRSAVILARPVRPLLGTTQRA